MKKYRIDFCVIVATVALFVSCTNNDEYDYFGKINGTVTDRANGAAISNANVILSPGGANRLTNSSGFYEFENLEPGDYYVDVQHIGYKTDKKNITVRVGETAPVNFLLVIRED
jgi:uncharacterized membrane protein